MAATGAPAHTIRPITYSPKGFENREMPYARFEPSPDLAPFVAALWVQQDLASAAARPCEPTRVLPTGFVDIAFYYFDQFVEIRHGHRRTLPRVVVTGPQTAYRTYAASGTTGIVLARFGPGAASAFLPISIHEIRDRNIDLADLIPSADVERVAQQVQAARDTRHRVARVEAFLRSRLRPDRAARDTAQAVRQIIASGGREPVAQLAEGLGLSPRQLQRRFRQGVGVGPKALGRIARLQRALDLRDSGLSWGITAHSAGYQDQSHLANDCRALAGLSPEQVFRRRRTTPLGSYYNAGPGAPAFFRTIYL